MATKKGAHECALTPLRGTARGWAVSPYGTSPIKRSRRSKQEQGHLDTALVELVRAHPPVTVRQVFYLATTRGLVPKDEAKGYRVVQRRLVALRAAGVIPYHWITDNVRMVRRLNRWQDPEHFASEVASFYRRDYWAHSPVRVKVWLEKDALAGVLYPVVVQEWGLELFVTRGFASVSYLEAAAEDTREDGRPTFVYVLTDLDPSGVDIARKIAEELPRRAPEVEVSVSRLAVTPEQVRALGLPTRPTKKTDTRARKFEARYGTGSVELDAIPPDTLRQMVRDAIERHADTAKLARLKQVERLERESLADTWGAL
jgi:hypothetical protein